MANIARKSDGRRIFTDEFKRKHIGRVSRGELSLAELSRKLGIARSLLQRWKRLIPERGEVASAASRRVAPVTNLGGAEYIRQLQLLVGRQTAELETLRAELDGIRNGWRSRGASRR